jgi:hypothetical protein
MRNGAVNGVILVILLVSSLSGCATKIRHCDDLANRGFATVPEWLTKPVRKDNQFYYAVGKVGLTSFGPSRTIKMAEERARRQLVEILNVEIKDFGIWKHVSSGDRVRVTGASATTFFSDVVMKGFETHAQWIDECGVHKPEYGGKGPEATYVLVRLPVRLDGVAREAGYTKVTE